MQVCSRADKLRSRAYRELQFGVRATSRCADQRRFTLVHGQLHGQTRRRLFPGKFSFCVHVYMWKNMYVCMYDFTLVHVCMHAEFHSYSMVPKPAACGSDKYLCLYAYAYTYTYTSSHTHSRTHAHTHTHTHTHTMWHMTGLRRQRLSRGGHEHTNTKCGSRVVWRVQPALEGTLCGERQQCDSSRLDWRTWGDGNGRWRADGGSGGCQGCLTLVTLHVCTHVCTYMCVLRRVFVCIYMGSLWPEDSGHRTPSFVIIFVQINCLVHGWIKVAWARVNEIHLRELYSDCEVYFAVTDSFCGFNKYSLTSPVAG